MVASNLPTNRTGDLASNAKALMLVFFRFDHFRECLLINHVDGGSRVDSCFKPVLTYFHIDFGRLITSYRI